MTAQDAAQEEICQEIVAVLKKYNLSFKEALQVLDITKITVGLLPINSYPKK
ncbi:hypothetical protein [Pectinatus frisingensis]|uniref:hypothetical protein n=1 Tax=Pectinatus frisingensis TaxID=865 RepID=UPI0018C59DF9|nr:hypothetical protein [Pectinatus frisingensis]